MRVICTGGGLDVEGEVIGGEDFDPITGSCTPTYSGHVNDEEKAYSACDLLSLWVREDSCVGTLRHLLHAEEAGRRILRRAS